MSVLEHRHQRLSSGSYELLASRCNAFAMCAQHNLVWLWLDGTTAVTIHIHHGAHATCVDRQPPESESMSTRKKVCCRLPSHEDSLKHTRLRAGDWHRTVFK